VACGAKDRWGSCARLAYLYSWTAPADRASITPSSMSVTPRFPPRLGPSERTTPTHPPRQRLLSREEGWPKNPNSIHSTATRNRSFQRTDARCLPRFSQDVDGRPLKVNESVARSERTERAPRGDRPEGQRNFEFDARKVYFGNLSWGMDHLDLQDLCSEFGAVEVGPQHT